jgi:hypothetical protein
MNGLKRGDGVTEVSKPDRTMKAFPGLHRADLHNICYRTLLMAGV